MSSATTGTLPYSDAARSQRNLKLGIGISVAVHALLLSIHFAYPDAFEQTKERVMDVVLVNAKHKSRPVDAQAKAQANLDAGGNTKEDRRATTFLPPATHTQEGDDVAAAQQRVTQLEAQARELMTQLKSSKKVSRDGKQADYAPTAPDTPGNDLVSRSMAIARLEAQIDRNMDEYNKMPRKKFIGTRTSEFLPAQYLEDWRQKIERVGNLNYPEAARGHLYGSLTVYIEIKADGSLARAEITRSSGQKVLDEAALRILRLAAPFAPFPAELRQQYDILAFARIWSFVQGDQIKSSAADR